MNTAPELKTSAAPAGVYVSPQQLNDLRACHSKYEMSTLNLNYPDRQMEAFLSSCVGKLKELLGAHAGDVKEQLVSYYDTGCKKEWFSLDCEYEASRENNRKVITRLYDYIMQRNMTLRGTDVPFKRSYTKPFNYRGKAIQGFAGRFDFVFETSGGKAVAVILRYDAPEESYRARKAENLPCNSVTLMSAYLGAKDLFKGPYSIEEWYLKNKDDTGKAVMEVFEHRHGKNVITWDFSDRPEAELMKGLCRSLQMQEKKACEDCCHKAACQVRPARMDTSLTDQEGVTTGEKQFTEAQKEIINHVNGPMCAVAVPGAGKTTVLVERLVHLVVDCHVNPTHILFVTFTKKAADEIRDRVSLRLKEAGIKKMPVISTYHALGYSILRENPLYVGTRIRLADETDRYQLIFQALKKVPPVKDLSPINPFGEYGIVRFLDGMIEEIETDGKGRFFERYKERYDVEGIWNVYKAYQSLYEEASFIGFDEMIGMAEELFQDHPACARNYAGKFEYLMVDEFQDSSESQVELIYAIGRCHNNVVVVGDDDQSIYRWRGGSSSFMLDFQRDFPQAKTVYMEDNFRSTDGILQVCSALIKDNGKRYQKKLISHQKGEHKPVYLKDVDRTYLRTVVAEALKSQKPGQIAILSRSNKKLQEADEILSGLCPVSMPKDYLIEDGVFLAVYDVLTLYFKGMDEDLSLYRLMKVLGAESLLKKTDKGASLFWNLQKNEKVPSMELTAERLQFFEAVPTPIMQALAPILRCLLAVKEKQLSEVLHVVLEELFHIPEHLVITDLLEIAEERGIVKIQDLYEVMDNMIRFSSTERVGYDVDPDAVNLLTCHYAKGKEFDTVIVYGMEDFGEEEEERRVLYVALSRARKNLFMIETAYNRYDGFDRIAPYVAVKGGCYRG